MNRDIDLKGAGVGGGAWKILIKEMSLAFICSGSTVSPGYMRKS